MDPLEKSRLGISLLVILAATMLSFLPFAKPVLTGGEWVSAVTWTVSVYIIGHAAGVIVQGVTAKIAGDVEVAKAEARSTA